MGVQPDSKTVADVKRVKQEASSDWCRPSPDPPQLPPSPLPLPPRLPAQATGTMDAPPPNSLEVVDVFLTQEFELHFRWKPGCNDFWSEKAHLKDLNLPVSMARQKNARNLVALLVGGAGHRHGFAIEKAWRVKGQ